MPHKEHYIDGKKAPSVTEFLDVIDKPELRYWYGKYGTEYCEQVKEASSEFGRRVHDSIESYFRGQNSTYELTPRQVELVKTALDWTESECFKVIKVECEVQSKKHLYGGTFDALGTFANSKDLWVVDWKTSNRVNIGYALQLAAYANAWNEENGKDFTDGINKGLILRLAKDEKSKKQMEIVKMEKLDIYFPYVLAARKLYDYVKAKGKVE